MRVILSNPPGLKSTAESERLFLLLTFSRYERGRVIFLNNVILDRGGVLTFGGKKRYLVSMTPARLGSNTSFNPYLKTVTSIFHCGIQTFQLTFGQKFSSSVFIFVFPKF